MIFVYKKKDFANYIVAKECFHTTGDVEMHRHDNFFLEYDFEFAYVVEGRARHIVNETVQELGAGDFVFLDYGVRHNYEIAEGEVFHIINLVFDYRALGLLHHQVQYLSELAHYYMINPEEYNSRPVTDYLFHDGEDEHVLQLFRRIQRELTAKNAGYYELVKGALAEIVIRGFRSYYGVQQSPAYSEDIGYIVNYVSDYYMHNLMLSDFAQELHLSLSYLSRKFKLETGMNYVEFLHRRRIMESCRLIAGTSDNIEQIAEYVGYPDTKSFRERFRKVMRMSPAEYKRMMRRLE